MTKKIRDILKEDGVTAGAGAIAGIGTGNQPEPGLNKSTVIKRSKFAGHTVFEVNSDFYHKSHMGKLRYHRYEIYVGNDETGQAIREYGRSNPGVPIILKNEMTGALQYLRYGKR